MNAFKIVAILLLAAGAAFGGYRVTENNLIGGVKEGQVESAEVSQAPTQKPVPNYPQTIGNFLVTDKEICREEDKPLVYFFGSSGCPHCVWEKPVAQKAFSKFKNEIEYHENFDNQDDSEVFERYLDINPGYVPFIVIGCKYARVGAGENLGTTEEESKKLEEEVLTALVCKLTDDKPASVCSPLKEKISQIN
jgi:thiol-disulfide isomerase/thioredoxin